MSTYSFYERPLRSDELYHHGIKGQKWGVRRFQNPDGSLKTAGVKRDGVTSNSLRRPKNSRVDGTTPNSFRRPKNARADRASSEAKTDAKAQKTGLSNGQKKALKVGAGVAVAAVTAYGGYKLLGGKHNTTRKALASTISAGKTKTTTALKNAGKNAATELKSTIRNSPGAVWGATKKGVRNGLSDAVKVTASGAGVYAIKKYLDKAYGEDKAEELIRYGGRQSPKKK